MGEQGEVNLPLEPKGGYNSRIKVVRHRQIGIKLQVGSTAFKPLTTAQPTIETASGNLACIESLGDELVVAEARRSR